MITNEEYYQLVSNEELYSFFLALHGRLAELEDKYEKCMIEKEEIKMKLMSRCCIARGIGYCDCHKNSELSKLTELDVYGKNQG